MIETAPSPVGVVCVVTMRDFRHLCPVRDEVDLGGLTVRWVTTDKTIELHSLAEYLRTWADRSATHEALTTLVTRDLLDTGVESVTAWFAGQTAGLYVEVSGGADALPGQRHQP